MADREIHTLFHIYRKDGTALILHPFDTPQKMIAILDKGDLAGRYGHEPQVETLTVFRNDLYRMIENGIRTWLNDVRFIPRFLWSTGAFLLVYFVLSYFVRDPLPILDELVGGLGAGIACYILMGRRDLRTERAAAKRAEWRAIVDGIVFRESDIMKMVEDALHRNETEAPEEVIQRILEPSRLVLPAQHREEADQFIQLLENRFNLKKLRKEEKTFKRYVKAKSRSPHLRKLVESNRFDFSLYAVYKSFKETVTNRGN